MQRLSGDVDSRQTFTSTPHLLVRLRFPERNTLKGQSPGTRVEKSDITTEDRMRLDDELVIPILRVSDAGKAVVWYRRLGFTEESVHRFGPGMPAFVTIARGPLRLFLSEHQGDARPDTLLYLRIRDVDAIAAEFDATVEQAPWAREIEIRDLDGNRLRIGTPTE
jgi:hypothetical protein